MPGHEQRCRFLVTSLNRHQVPPGQLYEDTYCPRGEMENRIKDCQLDLFADRMSAQAYKANQVRLIFAAFAYVLIDGIRRVALRNTALANAVPSTIRLKLLKIGARIVNSVRRIKLSLPDACPGKNPVLQGSHRSGAPIFPTHLRQRKKAKTSQQAELPSYPKSKKPIPFRTQLPDPAHFGPTENTTSTHRHLDPPRRLQIRRYKMAS